uniref:Uncharacterized protein n=1 Tax=Sus scrofa TaxID=9823 RepID=A0A4X1SVJ8_PIG
MFGAGAPGPEPWAPRPGLAGCTRPASAPRNTTHVSWSPQGQPGPPPPPFLRGGFGPWGRAELGTPVGTGRPSCTDFQRWFSLSPRGHQTG